MKWGVSSPNDMPVIFGTHISIKTLAKKMTSRARRWHQGLPKATYKGERDATTSPSDVKTPVTAMSYIFRAWKPSGTLSSPYVWHNDHNCSNQAHMSIIQGPENARATVWWWWVTGWSTVLLYTCQSPTIKVQCLRYKPMTSLKNHCMGIKNKPKYKIWLAKVHKKY